MLVGYTSDASLVVCRINTRTHLPCIAHTDNNLYSTPISYVLPFRQLVTSLSHSHLYNPKPRLTAGMSLLNNLIQVFDKYGRARPQPVENTQATQILQNVDEILDESWKMLAGIKSRLTVEEFAAIESRHNQLYLTVVDVKQDVRGRQKNKVFFASPDEQKVFLIRMRKLLERCEIHHTDVLSTSRRAHLLTSPQAPGSASTPSAPVSTKQGGSSKTEWLSIVSESNSSIDPSDSEIDISSLSQSDSESSSSSQRFIATVAHIPRSALATEEELKAQLPDDDSYYRILICGNKRKRAVIVDPNPHLFSANYDDEDAERSQDEILRVGDMLMKSDPQKLEGHQVVHSYRGPSFISSFISSWNYNNLPLGGMV
ncbi:unnamed protein product [Rhizoctonia solani]|uniref:Uncharacterized protein n=1 Tax=Rhizoctonia solani TaxID=456999 RepID=A0A8H2XN33_9AGAM|nr:unnamed protein product [Rhizoctonia solani]